MEIALAVTIVMSAVWFYSLFQEYQSGWVRIALFTGAIASAVWLYFAYKGHVGGFSWGYFLGMGVMMGFGLGSCVESWPEGEWNNFSCGVFLLLISGWITFSYFDPANRVARFVAWNQQQAMIQERQALVLKIESLAREALSLPKDSLQDHVEGKLFVVKAEDGKIVDDYPLEYSRAEALTDHRQGPQPQTDFKRIEPGARVLQYTGVESVAWVEVEYRQVGVYRQRGIWGLLGATSPANVITHNVKVIDVARQRVTAAKNFVGPDPPKEIIIYNGMVDPEGGISPADAVTEWLAALVKGAGTSQPDST